MSRLYSFARKGAVVHIVRGGFTLTEILVVILIIGILAAVAIPLYEKAVATTRFSGLMPVARSIKTGEEAYWMANGGYSSDLTKLDIELPNLTLDDNDFYHYGNGQKITVNIDSTHENVRMTDDRVDNVRYVAYFDRSVNFPGETHCEALTSNPNAKQICENLGATEFGSKGSYTTYLITGAGMGTLTDAPARLVSSNEQCVNSYYSYSGETCKRKVYDDGSYVEIVDGGTNGYWSKSCTFNSSGKKIRCSEHDERYSFPSVTEYDPETGNPIRTVEYRSDGSIYEVDTYDPETGNQLTHQYCYQWKNGVCTGGSTYKYTYDPETHKKTGEYYYGGVGDNAPLYNSKSYEYDENTGKLTSVTEYRNGKVDIRTEYDPETGNKTSWAFYNTDGTVWRYHEYDENGNEIAEYRLDSNGNVTSYEVHGDPDNPWNTTFDIDYYTYGANKGSVQSISGYDENDHSYSYRYDSNGNLTSASGYDDNDRYFSVSFNSSGNATSASGYDENGNYYSVRYDSNGNITSYSEDLGDGTVSYNANGSVKSKNISQSESTDSYDLYSSTSYSYNNDGSYSVTTDYSYDNWDTGESEYRYSTNYYTSDGTFAGSYDDNTGSEYRYTDGHLSSVSTEWGDGDNYTFYPDGSIKSASTNWGDTYIEYNQDGSINYDNSYDWYDENVSGYPQSSWGVSASDYPSYDSWGGTNDTHTQSSWGTADTSTWKQQSDFSSDGMPSQSDWPSQGSITPPDYTHVPNATYTDEERSSAVSEGVNNYTTRCADFPDAVGC